MNSINLKFRSQTILVLFCLSALIAISSKPQFPHNLNPGYLQSIPKSSDGDSGESFNLNGIGKIEIALPADKTALGADYQCRSIKLKIHKLDLNSDTNIELGFDGVRIRLSRVRASGTVLGIHYLTIDGSWQQLPYTIRGRVGGVIYPTLDINCVSDLDDRVVAAMLGDEIYYFVDILQANTKNVLCLNSNTNINLDISLNNI